MPQCWMYTLKIPIGFIPPFEDATKHFSEHGIEIKGVVNIDFKK